MAVKHISINGVVQDINDARSVVLGQNVSNIVALTAAQYDALQTKDSTTAYIVTDRTASISGGSSGGSEVSWGTESGYTVPLVVDGVSKTVCLNGYSAGGGSGVSDVTLGGTSVVTNNVAALPAYPTTLPASDVSSWAKASTKPTYTASEVGALPSSTVIPTVPTISTNITTDATSDTKTASPKAVKTYVDDIVGDIETLLAAI